MTTASDIERARSQLEWVRQRVLNVVGHELRTPATTIRGLADTLAVTDDPARAAELVGALRRQAARLERLVDDLLMAAGVETALPVGEPAPVALGVTATEVWAELGGDPASLDVTDAGVEVRVRAGSLRLILEHLFVNALAFGSEPTTVRARTAGGECVLTVESPGPPLPAEDVEFATEAFWRGERAVTSKPGLGLGLAIVRAAVGHEGGDMTVEALGTGGLCTTIRLPA